MAARTIKLLKPYEKQRQLLSEQKRFNVVSGGRRFGKTAFGQIVASQVALQEKPVGWFAPNNKYMIEAWREFKAVFKNVAERMSERDHQIILVNGGKIDFWTLDDPDAGRSRKYGLVIIDEADKVRDLEYSWNYAIRPTLTDLSGGAWFLSSPMGFRYFHELYKRGQSKDWPDWKSWIVPTSANPYINKKELAEIKRSVPEIVWRQEYLGQFVDSGGTLVKKRYFRRGVPNKQDVVFRVIGVDLASSLNTWADYTAMVLLEMTKNGELYVTDVRRGHWSFYTTQNRIKQFANEVIPNVIAVEKVQAQENVIQELQRTTSFNVKAINPNKFGDKVQRFMPLAGRYEQGLVYHAPGLIPQFEEEISVFPNKQLHDDTVDALSTAFAAIPKNRNYLGTITLSTNVQREVKSRIVPKKQVSNYGY